MKIGDEEMSKLIKIDDVLECIEDAQDGSKGTYDILSDVFNSVLALPSADAVEVVRCKDCRYWQEYQEGHYPNESCPWDKGETPDEDDYCSFGERREP